MNSNENILVCKAVRFFCLKDEDAFLEWIEKINCIDHTSALGREIYLHIATDKIKDQDLEDLIGLFYRYKIDMQQLAWFLTDENKEWFYDNKKAFWHKNIFKK